MGEIVRYKRDVWGEEVILGVSWDLLYVVFMAIIVLLTILLGLISLIISEEVIFNNI